VFVSVLGVDYDRRMFMKILSGIIVAALAAREASGGEDAKRVRAVEAVLPKHLGVCVMVMERGEVVFEYASGYADIESKAACTPATNFRMASVSKQFTATAVVAYRSRQTRA
jgi:CubicO group peptidase (beta-lactamase class C family)